ncbi:tripartite tricarboxylate transporter substrate binding protein [Pigmentiphaga kullae]|uniref:Tripartite-type tricarboxylate transporter receptor subunit TctC n=1 Tax=Pigmentiphaga kullae TaxID=151784 RepID=A0A4Q7NFQ8_9BURK|nr:tripartite tricarboxylate transporter substrate binding protein [Pigmentiphaga kullae]RZS81916.1 tripartite-type tricarboxylate transporter receptor subunit TctC [Pigmentiphaga kullae]
MPKLPQTLLGGLLLAAALPAAGAYPERAVRIIVPFAAGATLDLMTRAVAEELAHQLGQPVVVENRAGASGIIGADAVAKAPADGYTLMMAPFSVLAVNASLHKNLPYDNLRDLAPVALVAVAPHVLLASAQLPYRTLGELLAAAKARPGQIAYASAGAGSSAHLATEVLLYKAGVKMAHVPYKGTAPAYNDLIPGRVAVMIDGVGAALPRIQSGQVRALGVTSPEPVDVLPGVPTLAQAGVPGYDVTPWYGMVAPRGTPEAVVATLNGAVNRALATEGLRRRFAEMGLQPRGGKPADFGAYMASETAKWREVVQEAHVSIE